MLWGDVARPDRLRNIVTVVGGDPIDDRQRLTMWR